MELWAADGRAGLLRAAGGETRRVGTAGGALCYAAGRVYCAERDRCAVYDAATARRLFSFALPGGVCALACFGGLICALSADAGSVAAYSPRRGGIVFSAPAGIGPRGMAVSPDGRLLAVAGGEMAEALLFDRALRCARRFPLPGDAAAVAFCLGGLAALCAAGEERTQSRLVLLNRAGDARELLCCPGAPAALCALPGGGCAAGCDGALLGVKKNGEICFRRSCGYPAALRPCPKGALICDALRGDVELLNGQALLRADDLRDALLLP